MTSSSESSSQTSLELTLGTVLSLRIGKTDGYAHKRTVREASEAFNTISSFRNAVFDTSESCCIKKEREQKMSSHVEEEEGDCPKKKLRLSKEQSAVLEKCFEGQSTLSTQQKIGLAKELNLKTRQVEVWFQNRRARTKLKQIEEGYELLKKCCQNLREENRRLQEELEEIKALKIPLHMQLPATILTMCHACDHGEEEPVTKLKQIEEGYELLKKCCQNLREENRCLQEELEEIKALKIPLHMQLPATILTMCHACDHGEEEPVS